MQETKPISHFVAGAILGAVLVVYSILLQFLGQSQNQVLGYLSYAILIGGLIIFIQMYAKTKNNEVTFGNLFSYGFKATAIVILIMLVFVIVFNMAFPEFKEQILETTRQKMEEDGKTPDDQIETTINMIDKNYTLFAVIGTVIGMAILGAIGSLIGAAVTKKKAVNPMDQMSI